MKAFNLSEPPGAPCGRSSARTLCPAACGGAGRIRRTWAAETWSADPAAKDRPCGSAGPGGVTDVLVCGLLILRGVMRDGGRVPSPGVGQALLRLKTDPSIFRPYLDRVLDPVTRAGLDRLDGSYLPTRFDRVPCDGRRINCSAAARAWVAGL